MEDRIKYLLDRQEAILKALEEAEEDSMWEIELQNELKEIQDELAYLNGEIDMDDDSADEQPNLN